MKHGITTTNESRPRALSRRRRTLSARFIGERSAVAAIEFAMVSPILILLILETFQLGLYFYTSATLNYATNAAARQIRVGAVAASSETAAQFKANFCSYLSGAMPCANVIQNLYTVPEGISPAGFYAFLNTSQTGLAPPQTNTAIPATFCPGQPGSVIYVQNYYAMPIFSPIWYAVGSQNFNGSVVHFVLATAAFKNEPYQGAQADAAAAGC
jgi:Flp pilus assembly protein TadG